MISRRALFITLGTTFVAGRGFAQSDLRARIVTGLRQVESEVGCRLGVAVRGAFGQIDWRGDERFPLCSTFKVLAAAAILKNVDEGRESIERRVVFDARGVVVGSPITGERVGGDGMSLAELCEAAITRSDNTAGNLMLAAIGGPAGLTAFARSIGDPITRLDRIEPELNESIAGDPRDTTTPLAMLADLNALLLGDVLSRRSCDQLLTWLIANKTGDMRLRAGLPAQWRVGDKTGTGENGSANDVAIIWPPGQKPLLMAVYITGTSASMDQRNTVFASVARLIALNT